MPEYAADRRCCYRLAAAVSPATCVLFVVPQHSSALAAKGPDTVVRAAAARSSAEGVAAERDLSHRCGHADYDRPVADGEQDTISGEAQRHPGTYLAGQYLEEQKLAFEFVKHVTTLATGTLVLLATFLKDVFKNPSLSPLVPLTFGSLMVSVVALSLAAFGLLQSIRHPGAVPQGVRVFTGSSALVGVGAFLLGLLLLAVFSIGNWV
jgi:hypothetical protein